MDDYDPDSLSKDDAFHHAKRPYRRAAVRILLDAEGAMGVESLAAEVVASEADCPPEAVDGERQQEAYLTLLHRDLPTLTRQSVVEFDPDAETVAAGPNIDDLEPLV